MNGKSVLDLMLLGFLLDTPRNAYDLSRFIESHHIEKLLKISKPGIYKKCKQLYKSGLLDGKRVREGETPEKVIYSVNKEGKDYFYSLMEHFSEEIKPFYFEHNAFLWNLDKLTKQEGVLNLQNLQTSFTALKDWLVSHEESVNGSDNFGLKALVKQYRMVMEAMVAWITETIEDYRGQ